ncbi:chaperone modulator CbpM [Pseudomonas helleri]|uniref:chaperone modulator CbpM n=1 Tax=Pseudomonas helleri TaxID=1608996 RepID=UPI0028E77266|nr:chaperone modulator CbpM [Pseudomonas helleri]
MSSTLIVQLDMERFCEEANIPATYVIEIVEHGIIEPQGRTPDVWRFEDYELVVAKRAAKLHRDLDMEWEGVALALELLDEVQQLRSENRRLKQQLGRFVGER